MMAENILPSKIVHASVYIRKFYDVPQITYPKEGNSFKVEAIFGFGKIL